MFVRSCFVTNSSSTSWIFVTGDKKITPDFLKRIGFDCYETWDTNTTPEYVASYINKKHASIDLSRGTYHPFLHKHLKRLVKGGGAGWGDIRKRLQKNGLSIFGLRVGDGDDPVNIRSDRIYICKETGEFAISEGDG